jgi:hypothetical protein
VTTSLFCLRGTACRKMAFDQFCSQYQHSD